MPEKRATPTWLEVLSIFDYVASASSVGLGFVDRSFRITSISSVFASVNGGAVEDQVGRLLKEVVPGLWPQLDGLYRHGRGAKRTCRHN